MTQPISEDAERFVNPDGSVRPKSANERDHIVIGWHRIAWQMVRHLCGPKRAAEHELGDRYAKVILRARSSNRPASHRR